MTDKSLVCRVCGRDDFVNYRGRRVHEVNAHKFDRVARPEWRPFREHPQTERATIEPTPRLLEWAAGYLEGEGCFTIREYPAPRKPAPEITAGSTDLEPLQLLRGLFGGRLSERRITPNTKRPHKRPHMWVWAVYGSRALGVAQTLYPMLWQRRQEAVRRMLTLSRVAYAR